MNAQTVPELSYGEIVWVPREAYDAALRRAEIAEGQARLNAQTVIAQAHEIRKLERDGV